MDIKDILTEEQLLEIHKKISEIPEYKKHKQLFNKYVKESKYAQASIESKIIKEIESKVFMEFAKSYIDLNKHVVGVIESMENDDKKALNTLSNSLFMLTDVLNNIVINTNLLLKKYGLNETEGSEKLRAVLKETNTLIAYFDKTADYKKESSLFGYMCDNLYEMIYNKASSYTYKMMEYEKNVRNGKIKDR